MDKVFGMEVVVRPDWAPDRWEIVQHPTNPVEAAAMLIGAAQSDMPGLWTAPGYPELTAGQLLEVAFGSYRKALSDAAQGIVTEGRDA